MKRHGRVILLVSILLWPVGLLAVEFSRPQLVFKPEDRLLILAPHPDDEVLGCAGVIQKAVSMKLPVHVVFLTNGDGNRRSFLVYERRPVLKPEAVRKMGLVRHDEALAAAKVLGLSPDQLTFLGYPDRATLKIWYAHWNREPPYHNKFTDTDKVPYANAFRPRALYKGDDVLADLEHIIKKFHPTKIFVSHPGDHHPDHRALVLFTYVALWDLEGQSKPGVFPYLVHFKGWPRPLEYRSDRSLEPPASLKQAIPWSAFPLSRAMMELKRDALKAHKTQYGYSSRYLLPLIRENELFGDFPAVRVGSQSTPSALTFDSGEHAFEVPDQLTDEEKASFVGFEKRYAFIEDGRLVLSIHYARPLAKEVRVSVYVFGYRNDKPFTEMPKLHIQFGWRGYEMFDQSRGLPSNSVEVIRKPKETVIKVPLKLLGNPQKVLTSARSYLLKVPLDWVSWRVLELEP